MSFFHKNPGKYERIFLECCNSTHVNLNKFGRNKERCRKLRTFGTLRKNIDHCPLSLAKIVSVQILAKMSMDVVLLMGRKSFMQKERCFVKLDSRDFVLPTC